MRRVIVMWLDYTGLPRAWGAAPENEQAAAEAVALEHLKTYCAKQAKLGEIDLADQSKYTRKIEHYNGEG